MSESAEALQEAAHARGLLQADANAPHVELRRIGKRFPGGVLACDQIDLEVRPGEVLALLGENGAGKTTLMHVLSGLIQPTSGEIRVDGEPVVMRNTRVAIEHGIGMVHQRFLLVPPLTVAQNVTLGREPGGVIVDRRRAEARVSELSRSFGLELDPAARVAGLSVGLQQRVEIVKALYGGARVLILDEPTAALTPQESGHLFEVVRQMVAGGRSVVFISHKLREVKEIASRIVVLRHGRVIDEVSPETGEAELAALMVGRTISLSVEKQARAPGPPLLRVEGLTVAGEPGLDDVSFDVRAGEILGIAGVDGNGQLELEESLAGLRPIESGAISLEGRSLAGLTPRRLLRLVGRIPSDRARWGLVPEASVAENLCLLDYGRSPFAWLGVLRWRRMRQFALRLIDEFDVRTTGPRQRVATLSGGNQQKLVVGREISRKTRVLIAAQPTRGIDVGATLEIHKLLLSLADAGAGVLLISADLDEVIGLSDRVAVLYRGRVMGVTDRPDRQLIGIWMAGARPAAGGGESS